MTIDDLLKMKLHECEELRGEEIRIVRVVGGWIYESYTQHRISTTFVPEPKKGKPADFRKWPK